MTAAALLTVSGVDLGFGGAPLVRGLSAEVASGEIVAFAAPSGAGKTTLLRTLVRLAEPQAGQIRLAGTSIDAIPGPDLRRRVALVAQRPVLLGQTVADDLQLGAARPLTPREAVDALEEVGLGAPFAERASAELSGGEAARVAVARALLMNPEVLLLDEPSAALDEAATRMLGAALRARADRGLAVVLVTHDPVLLTATAARQIELPTHRSDQSPRA